MSEPLIPLPLGTRYIRLVCRLGRLTSDSTSDMDAHPDLLPLTGTLTLRTNPSRLKILEEDGQWRYLVPDDRTYNIRADGELVDKEGRVGVYIIDPLSPTVDPKGFTITAIVQPLIGEKWHVTVGGNAQLPPVLDLVGATSIVDVPALAKPTLEARLAALEAIDREATLVYLGNGTYEYSGPEELWYLGDGVYQLGVE